MKIFTYIIIVIFSSLIFSHEDLINKSNEMVEIETKDGNILLGYIIDSDDNGFTLETKDGLKIMIPKSSVLRSSTLEIKDKDGRIFRADPNKSLYIFAPSAFPIENKKSYCRDFCVFFPSYNRGFSNNFSLQLGAFVVPGMSFDDVPIVLSGKFSFPEYKSKKFFNASFASGLMYVRLPEFGEDSFGFGIVFGTMTLGDKFNHFSTSIGFGYSTTGADWEFQEKPIYNLSGNFRFSNSIAFVGESWVFPEGDLDDQLFALSLRFIGRKFAVDLGGLMTLSMLDESVIPIPILNFTYHTD